jgi:hypothetical protein
MKDLKEFWKNNMASLGVMFGLLLLIFVILLFVSEVQWPSTLLSSGLLAVISAIVGVILTGTVTVFLLQRQSETQKKFIWDQSEADKNTAKDIKIYEQKIQVYSEFTKQMWGMLDEGQITSKALKDLRTICFRELVFHLDNEQIKQIRDAINSIEEANDDKGIEAIGNITHILQNNLNKKEEIKTTNLITLFNSFENFKDIQPENLEKNTLGQDEAINAITYWHFIIFDVDKQISAFKDGNWVLALIEYDGEDWKKNLVQQVKPDDVIFLYQRKGPGYIGAFRALDPAAKILTDKEFEDGKYTDDEIAKYDIYGCMEDGGSFSSNLLVKPIAYNYKGVRYKNPKLRTIQRILNIEEVEYLLNRLNGKGFELGEDSNRKDGAGKFDENTPVPVTELDSDYFNKLLKKHNLLN